MRKDHQTYVLSIKQTHGALLIKTGYKECLWEAIWPSKEVAGQSLGWNVQKMADSLLLPLTQLWSSSQAMKPILNIQSLKKP